MPLNLLGSSCSSGGGKRIKGRKGRKSRKSRMSGKKRKSGTFKKSRGRSFKLSRGKRITRKGRRRRRTRRGGGPKNIFKKSREYLSKKFYGSPPPASEFLTKESLIKLITDAEPYGIGVENENYKTFADNKQKFLDNIDEIFVKFKELPPPAPSINVDTGGGIYNIWIQYDIPYDHRRQQFNIENINGKIITNNILVESGLQV
jgi:hypothetical protein